jgi:prepilin-type N-terminal cleavage/methylation domain-containing protein
MERKQKGFSLLELLIVVVIILVIAAIAIPSLLRSRMSANEASAIASMRTIVTSEIIYAATYTVGFSNNLPSLSDGGATSNCFPPAIPAAASACLIDSSLAAGTKSGYSFTYATTGASGMNTFYTLKADPINVGSSGQRHFYTDETHVLRVNDTAVASTSDPPL